MRIAPNRLKQLITESPTGATVWGGEEGCHWKQALKLDTLTPVPLHAPN